jgi:type IV pilus assembly protein PilV
MTPSRHHAIPVRPRAPRPRAGFSLVAVMVSIVLLGTGAMALAAANASTIRAQGRASTRSVALATARAYVEELRARDPWGLASESAVAIDESGRPDAAGAYSRRTVVTQVRTNLVRVDVVIDGPRLAQPITVGTHVYRGGTLHRQ